MNVPAIPSDNLYKFICIASLVSIIILSYNYSKTSNELRIEIEQLDGDTRLLKKESDFYTDLLDSYTGKITEDKKTELLELGRKLTKKESELYTKTKIFRLKNNYLHEDLRNFRIIVIPLFIILIYGFYQWYFKVQRYQDKLLKHQADNLTVEKN